MAVALQNEGYHILERKAEACLGDAPFWVNWKLDEDSFVGAIDQEELDLIPVFS